ncbi:cytochrome b/b6 domain-containing protein [Roseovarius aestuariivivens]|uniref:cytochrome b/b6 domain-containing protein n=1 Tax=Roseovarius aestuariivivens TaxID=1888910 RepID=UPI001081C34C|nr:cytochrome b/b6 domain-containing protein [Roseovarius aestuariivivens]
MPLINSRTAYGSVTKTFHWLIAVFILVNLPLGLVANEMAHAIRDPAIETSDAYISRTALLFSLHKTMGLAVFFFALGRILWALSQPKPALLNGDKPLEAHAAETVHWLLYGSLVIVPLSGWIHHAAVSGYAPIWWPFGQGLPFVPKDESIAETFAGLHHLSKNVLIAALLLHVAGALKHHVIDKDATLRRMLPGRLSAEPTSAQPRHIWPFLAAVVIWMSVLGASTVQAVIVEDPATQTAAEDEAQLAEEEDAASATAASVENGWTVTDGALGITIRQMGSDTAGAFSDWSAEIVYDEATGTGQVDVTVTISSLTLGSVTDQAMGPDYFDTANHPRASFSADIRQGDNGHVAAGTLTIKGNSAPVELPFALTIDGDTARAEGNMTVDRRNFGIGAEGEDNVGASVGISFDLTATRQ